MPIVFDSKSRPCRQLVELAQNGREGHVDSFNRADFTFACPVGASNGAQVIASVCVHDIICSSFFRLKRGKPNSLCPYFMLHRPFQRHPKARTGQSLVVGSIQSSWCQAIAPILRGFRVQPGTASTRPKELFNREAQISEPQNDFGYRILQSYDILYTLYS